MEVILGAGYLTLTGQNPYIAAVVCMVHLLHGKIIQSANAMVGGLMLIFFVRFEYLECASMAYL